ncbi:MAG: proprotein convertase P-domain-containing protein [Bacteroidia bacterium]|nr:proprotein convertase P-domain-containing protein [Bacteroidia bacterium]
MTHRNYTLSLIRKIFVAGIILLTSSGTADSKDTGKEDRMANYWSNLPANSLVAPASRVRTPEVFRPVRLDVNAFKSILGKVPAYNSPVAANSGVIISLPMPDGNMQRFRISESEVMAPGLASKFPMIKTYNAAGVDDPAAVGKLDFTMFGFHAMILSSSGWYFIEPFSLGNLTDYISYDKKYSRPDGNFVCETEGQFIQQTQSLNPGNGLLRSSGTQLKTYRLALACTGEYAAYYGGTVAGAMSGMVTSVNRVSGVYELELAVRLVLIANDSLLVYTNASTDPYTNGNGSTMLSQNITNINSVIGSANYDIGHVFSTGGGGVAGLGVVCGSSKARGVTGSSAPIGDNYDIDYVAHEMGHQFGGNHTFNSVTGSCNGNRASSAAYEPGSGTTIMGYAGICGADDIQPHSDAIFASKSYDEIQAFITTGNGNTCPVVTNTGNTPPAVNAGSNYTIPYLTPFALTGSGTDADGDPLTYLWEEYDLGPSGTPDAPSGNAPIFRVWTPVSNPTRIFPRMQDIVRNQHTLGELLPSYARTMNFKFTARDNRLNGGGVGNNSADVVLTVVNTGTAFSVTSPNTSLIWQAGSTQTVTWNVSGTTANGINCANVNILLSVDSGYTYPYLLAASTPNDGSQSITVPGVVSPSARIKVEGAGNIFFDISDVNFTIQNGSGVLSVIVTQNVSASSYCAGSAVNVPFYTDAAANSGNVFTAQLSGSSGSFSSPVSIGTLAGTMTTGTIACVIPPGTTAGSGYRIRVVSSNPAVTGSDNGSNITIGPGPGIPGSITGTSVVCQGQTGVVYSVAAVANATGYQWDLPSGCTIASGANTNTITVDYSGSATGGNITVTGTNSSCGTGPSSPVFSITVNVLPDPAGIISGPAYVCQSSGGYVYSVPAIPGATGYNWSLPAGATISSGNNSNSITVSFSGSAISGIISVSGTNACGQGGNSQVAVTVSSAPSAVSVTPAGTLSICTGGSVTLSFSPLPGVNYQWYHNSSVIPGETNSTYLASTAGNYTVESSLPSVLPQDFSNNTSISIPDNSCTGASSSVTVSGYTQLIPASGISITVNITHTWVGDLVLFLEAPDGNILGLTNRTGNTNNSGDNFTNTVFSGSGSNQIPASGAPYTGTYLPQTSTFTSCISSSVTSFGAIGGGNFNPNGSWILRVYDRAGQDVGTIDNWSLHLPGTNPGGCTSMSNSVVLNVISAPVVNSFTPVSGITGNSITINGTGFTGATSVLFNGISAAFSVNSDAMITATVPAGATTGPVSVITPCGTGVSAGNFTISGNVTLVLKVFIEGFMNGPSTMNTPAGSPTCDTLVVRLADAGGAHAFLYASTEVINASGNGFFSFPSSVTGNSYYIVVQHRNALETWSATPVAFSSGNVSYDFTTSAGKAYGSNQAGVNGGFALYSGDVNQDGLIESADFGIVENDSQGFLFGYVDSDLTGDNIVESSDNNLVQNNSQSFLLVARP